MLQTSRLVNLIRFVLNDSYRTDMCLIYPPHLIAVTALYVTAAVHCEDDIINSKIISFISTLNIDMYSVVEAAQKLLSLYSIWSHYDESRIPSLLESLKSN